MNFTKREHHLSDNTKKSLTVLYEKYAQKLLGYTCKNYTIDKDDALAVVYKTLYKIVEVTNDSMFENEQKRSAFIFKTHIHFLHNFSETRGLLKKTTGRLHLLKILQTVNRTRTAP